MTTLTTSRLARTATLCALYCAQGMPWGFVTITLLAYLGERGLTLEQTSEIMALATMPWSFKVVWGLVIDRFTLRSMGRRRPWVLLAQLGIGLTLLSMILSGDITGDVQLLAWMVFVNNCFVSLQDVASDALAVDVLDPEERGRVNGLMWGSNYLGVAIGGAGMGTVLAQFGLQAAFGLQVGVLFLVVLFPLLLRERAGEKLLPWSRGAAHLAGDERPESSVKELTLDLLRAFATRGALLGLLFAAVNSIMVGMMNAVNPMFCVQEVGWTQEAYSQVDGGVGALAGVAGAVVGGLLVDRMGVFGLITLASVSIAAVCVTLGLSDGLRVDDTAVTAYILVCNVLVSAQTVAGFSLFMRLCKPVVAGTQFTLFMAAGNFARVVSAWIVGALAGHGYGIIFVVMGVSMLAALPFLALIPESRRVRAGESAAGAA